jgi:IS30 family transposase
LAHKHLTQQNRYHIYALKKAGNNNSEIAKDLGVDKSTISRELSRNSGQKGYRPAQANDLACLRKENASTPSKMTVELMMIITHYLEEKWSPEQISGWLLKNKNISISHESIYQFILADKISGGTLWLNLRWQKKRKKRYGTKSHDRRGQIKNKVSIEKRPKIVDKKIRIGDWEGDLVIGKNHKKALVTLVDRKSKKVKIAKVESKNAVVVRTAICNLLKNETVFTATFDNGKEFTQHELIAKKLEVKVYFAHPYSSWERGLNENTNGLIRQYFSKGSSFENITDKDVQFAEDALNNRPRKTLGFCTPNEIYSGEKRIRVT